MTASYPKVFLLQSQRDFVTSFSCIIRTEGIPMGISGIGNDVNSSILPTRA